ncbi:hypothetical protein RR11_3317 [Ruegeria sp. R11]|nr:hypothetical protein RR11_3317 [Ruegeria sp. R11]
MPAHGLNGKGCDLPPSCIFWPEISPPEAAPRLARRLIREPVT